MDALGRFTAIVMAIVLICLIPIQYSAQMQSENIDNRIKAKTEEFTQMIRQEQKITKTGYEDFCRELSDSGGLYDTDIQVAHPANGEEIGKLFDDDNGADAKNVLSNPRPFTHVHTDACYAGHNHEAAGDVTGYMCTCGGTNVKCIRQAGFLNSVTYYFRCTDCNAIVAQIEYKQPDYTYNQGTWSIMSRRKITYTTGAYSYDLYTLSYYSNSSGTQGDHDIVYIYENVDSIVYPQIQAYNNIIDYKTLYTLIPSFNMPLDQTLPKTNHSTLIDVNAPKMCALPNDNNPICNQVVTSITATIPVQEITQSDPIVTTATATYLDGHTGEVACTASGFDTNAVGTQTVILTYSGLVNSAKTTGIITCTIAVTVKPKAHIPAELIVNPTSTTVYNGTIPSYVVAVKYTDGSIRTVADNEYAQSGWSSGSGIKTVVFTYTEEGITATATVTITVLPNLTGLTAVPVIKSVNRYSPAEFTVTAFYEDGSTKLITSGYQITGFDSSVLGAQTVTFTYTENGITRIATAQITVKNLERTCSVCGTVYQLDDNDVDQGCPVCKTTLVSISASPQFQAVRLGENISITLTATYRDNHTTYVTGWTSDFDPYILGLQNVTITYFDQTTTVNVNVENTVNCPICGLEYTLNEDGSDPGCPVCSKTVVSIIAAPDVVTMQVNEEIPITVTAVFADGHTEVVTKWTNNLPIGECGMFETVISYKDCTDTITVNVMDPGLTHCEYCGLDYDASVNPGGCPVCSVTLTGIKAQLENGGTQVIKGSDLKLEITLIFRDEHMELVDTGYTIDGYDPTLLGTQEITVYYSDFSTTLMIEVVSGGLLTTCPNGHEYYLNEDGSDPGCPFCDEGTEKESSDFIMITYNKEIMDVLYTNGVVYLETGDYVTVTVTKKSDNIYDKMHAALSGKKTIYKELCMTGGIVRPVLTGANVPIIEDGIMVTCPNGHDYYLNEDGSDPGCPICGS